MTTTRNNTAQARTANLLGALVLSLNDEIRDATEAISGSGGEASAALVSIHHTPACSIDFLARTLRRSHPGTVRLVDRLAALDLVERRPGTDGRTVALHLTRAGELMRKRVVAARRDVLERALASVPDDMQEALAGLLETTLKAVRGPDLDRGYTICRLCEGEVCMDCPMEA